MRQDFSMLNYDFMHGALGVGLYFLKKKTNPEHIQELVDFLYDTAEKDIKNNTYKWKSIVEYEKNNYGYNLALSHGITSIIIFLSLVVKNGKSNKKVINMLSGAISFILSQQKNFLQFGSYFPNHFLENSPTDDLKSRLAWCYGDLGIGIAFWQAGKTTNNQKWKNKGTEILLQSTKRRTYNDTYIREAGICHGSAGVALIFRRIFLETHCNEFMEATQYWINKTLELSICEDGLAGYKSLIKDNWVCDYSLLTGVAGIGLVLLSLLDNNQQKWDEVFLLS